MSSNDTRLKNQKVEEKNFRPKSPEKKSRKRPKPTQETLLEDVKSISTRISVKIEEIRESIKKNVSIRFLQSLNSDLKTLEKHIRKAVVKKSRKPRDNTNCGFLKKVPVSVEISKFAGWNVEEEKSRTDVTRFICDYIKDKNLKRKGKGNGKYIDPDKNLAKLLRYDKERDGDLTYPRIQTHLKHHFPKGK